MSAPPAPGLGHALAALDQRYSLVLELRRVLLLRNPLHLFPPVNVNATTLPLEGEIRGEAHLWLTCPSRRAESRRKCAKSKVLYSVRIPSETMHASLMVPREIARGDAITTE